LGRLVDWPGLSGKQEIIDRTSHSYTISDVKILCPCIAIASFALTACTSVQITAQKGQRVVYNHGAEAVLCSKKNGQVGMVGAGTWGPARLVTRVSFEIYYRNLSKNSVDFDLSNISATNGEGRPIRLCTKQELEHLDRVDAAFGGAAIAMNAASSSFAAAMPSYTTSSGSFNTMGTTGTYTGSATTYNPAQTAIANQAIQANSAVQIQALQNHSAISASQTSMVVSRTTVPPGGSLTGLVVVKKTPVVNFKVSVNGEEYTANFLVK